jgi:hypothetical protein
MSEKKGKKNNVVLEVEEEDFFACCVIGVTKAKAVMGQKELDRISTTVPGTYSLSASKRSAKSAYCACIAVP